MFNSRIIIYFENKNRTTTLSGLILLNLSILTHFQVFLEKTFIGDEFEVLLPPGLVLFRDLHLKRRDLLKIMSMNK